MIDAHFHRGGFPAFMRGEEREVRFYGFHPWQTDASADIHAVRAQLAADSSSGVGEIGLDRLKSRTISDSQREIFARQLALAAELHRPVVLHGAKCWGEVVAACRKYKGEIPCFLFHGFSRSAGLLPEIFAIGGYVSVGPAILNDHAVNYRALVKELPSDRILVETDMDYALPESDAASTLRQIAATLASLRGEDIQSLDGKLAANVRTFMEPLLCGR